MGRAFARRLRERGHAITIANSRGPQTLRELAEQLGVAAGSVFDAVRDADVVFLAIPTKAVPTLPPELFTATAERAVVIDVGNYHPELRDGRIDELERGLPDSQWVARQIRHPVVKAFNTILAQSLLETAAPSGVRGRVALPVSGDTAEEKTCVARLVEELGFDAIDAGDLQSSWRQQTGTPAYCKDLCAADLERALASAERSRISEYRAAREAELRGATPS